MKYLDHSVIHEPNSIEEFFCKPLDENGKRDPLNEIMMKLLIYLATSKSEDVDILYGKAKTEWTPLTILEDRLESLNCKVDKGPLVVISMACKTPGECVMYANYIAYKTKEIGSTSLDMNDFCTHVFPTGFFSEETLREYWDKQKVNSGGSGSDNLLDYLSAADSLITK